MSNPVIILVTPGFPKNEADNACLPAFQQFALSVKNQFSQYKLIVVAFQYPFEKIEYQWNGIDVIALGGKNRSKIYRLVTWIRAYSALKKIVTHYPVIGLVSLWVTECAFVSEKFSKKFFLNHLIWIIGQDAKSSNKYVSRIKPEAEQLIAMSDFLKDEFHKNHAIAPQHVFENGITETIFPELNLKERRIDIFGAGSLIPLKNYSLFIELVAEVKKEIPNVKANIAGGGEEQKILEFLIKTLELENNIKLLGPKTHAEILALMNSSNVFLHTSNYEGNSTVLMEALYSGCKVISTCPLSHAKIEQLYVSNERDELKQKLIETLSFVDNERKRVTFNTMDRSVQRIVNLLLQK